MQWVLTEQMNTEMCESVKGEEEWKIHKVPEDKCPLKDLRPRSCSGAPPCPSSDPHPLTQQTFSVKGQMVSVSTTHLCHDSLKADTVNM